jgi:hypothetical protein
MSSLARAPRRHFSRLDLWRAEISSWARTPWGLLALFAGDLVELVTSFALASASPPPLQALPYAAFDVPPAPFNATLGVALMGIAAGLLMGAALVAELVVMARRAQILGWKRRRRALSR